MDEVTINLGDCLDESEIQELAGKFWEERAGGVLNKIARRHYEKRILHAIDSVRFSRIRIIKIRTYMMSLKLAFPDKAWSANMSNSTLEKCMNEIIEYYAPNPNWKVGEDIRDIFLPVHEFKVEVTLNRDGSCEKDSYNMDYFDIKLSKILKLLHMMNSISGTSLVSNLNALKDHYVTSNEPLTDEARETIDSYIDSLEKDIYKLWYKQMSMDELSYILRLYETRDYFDLQKKIKFIGTLVNNCIMDFAARVSKL